MKLLAFAGIVGPTGFIMLVVIQGMMATRFAQRASAS
jgi:hypothetical protein